MVYLNKKHSAVQIGLKFKYDKNSQESIDALFAFTEIPRSVKGVYLESGYTSFFEQKSYEKFSENLKYLSLDNNIIGSEKESFNVFLNQLKLLKNLFFFLIFFIPFFIKLKSIWKVLDFFDKVEVNALVYLLLYTFLQ